MVRLVTFEDPEVQASSRKEAIKKVKKILADTDDQVLLRNSISEFVGDITQSLFLFLLLSSFLCLDIMPKWKIKTDFWIHKSFGRSFVCTHPFCKRKTLEGAGWFCMLFWKSLVRDKIAVVWPKVVCYLQLLQLQQNALTPTTQPALRQWQLQHCHYWYQLHVIVRPTTSAHTPYHKSVWGVLLMWGFNTLLWNCLGIIVMCCKDVIEYTPCLLWQQRFRDVCIWFYFYHSAGTQKNNFFPMLPLTRGQENTGAHHPVPAAPVEVLRVQRAAPPAATLMTEHHREAPR